MAPAWILPAHLLQDSRLLTWCTSGPEAACGRHTAEALPPCCPWRSELWRGTASPRKREESGETQLTSSCPPAARPRLPPPRPGRLALPASPLVPPGPREAVEAEHPARPECPWPPWYHQAQGRSHRPPRPPNHRPPCCMTANRRACPPSERASHWAETPRG